MRTQNANGYPITDGRYRDEIQCVMAQSSHFRKGDPPGAPARPSLQALNLAHGQGWLSIENVAAISWLGLFSVAGILAVGMSWSHWRPGRATPPG